MATGMERKQRGPWGLMRGARRFDASHATEREPDGEQPVPTRPRRSRWLVGVLVVLVVLLWLGPTIVAKSSILSWIVTWAAADLKGTVTARSASLGWFSAPSLRGLEIRDEQGESVLEISEIRSDRSLLALLWDYSNLGRIRLERPTLHVVVRKDGSNLEDMLASYLASTEDLPDGMNLGVEIVDGAVTVRDAGTGQTWQIVAFALAMAMPADRAQPIELQASGVLSDADAPGRFSVKLRMAQTGEGEPTSRAAMPAGAPSGDPQAPGSNELALKTEGVPLAMFQSLLDRLGLELQTAGGLSTDFRCQWDSAAAPGKMVVQGTASADDLVLSAPSLKSDQVKLKRLQATCKLAWQGDRVDVERLTVDSDVASASLTGSLDLSEGETASLLRRLPGQTFEASGRVDLARLAEMLPRTLRIREGTHVTSGQLQVAAASRRGPEGMSWQGTIEATDLAAESQGRPFAWRRPVLVSLQAHEGPQGPIVQTLRCDSDFLTLNAAGRPEQLTASASFDLTRMSEQLSEIVDLGEVHLVGDGSAQFRWEQPGAGDFRTDAELQVRNLVLAIPDRPTWTEESLVVNVSASGRTDFTADTRIDNASVALQAGEDRLTARLTQPVLDVRDGGVWPVEVRSRGDLARWSPRVSPWIALGDWSLAGSYELAVQGTGSAEAIQVDHGRFAVAELAVKGPRLDVREPQAELIVAGRWSRERGRLELDSAALTSPSLSAQAEKVVCAFADDGPPELLGTVTFRGSLDRLRKWTLDPAQPPEWHVLGRFSGKAELRHSGGTTAAQLDATIDDLVATHPSGQQFDESRIRLSGQGTYDAAGRFVRLQHAQLSSGTVGLRAAGEIALEEERTGLRLGGQLDYDMEKISELLSAYAGTEILFAGQGSGPITYQGPLALDGAQATAAVRWTRGQVYGFSVGPGELAAGLSSGVLQIQPCDLAVSDGRVRLSPTVRLAPEPAELHVEPGRVVENVRINRQMCDSFLQYIAPALAGVATAEGRFSIELGACRVPLANPEQAELTGRMIVHSVTIGPGPMIYELAVLLGRASPAKLTRESVIPFRLAGGRVYHSGLELVFPDLTIRTQGSVGLDQSLELMAEMPVPPKWRGKNDLLDSALRDQIIRVPIGGTLSKPQLDRKTLDQLSQRFLENAARNVLQDGLNRGLQQLFGTQPQLR